MSPKRPGQRSLTRSSKTRLAVRAEALGPLAAPSVGATVSEEGKHWHVSRLLPRVEGDCKQIRVDCDPQLIASLFAKKGNHSGLVVKPILAGGGLGSGDRCGLVFGSGRWVNFFYPWPCFVMNKISWKCIFILAIFATILTIQFLLPLSLQNQSRYRENVFVSRQLATLAEAC